MCDTCDGYGQPIRFEDVVGQGSIEATEWVGKGRDMNWAGELEAKAAFMSLNWRIINPICIGFAAIFPGYEAQPLSASRTRQVRIGRKRDYAVQIDCRVIQEIARRLCISAF